ALNKFEYISRHECTFIFGVTNRDNQNKAYDAIKSFRKNYNELPNKNNNKTVEELIKKTWHEAYGKEAEFLNSWSDYSDAMFRALSFTNMFIKTGRGNAGKIRVFNTNNDKFKLLVNKFEFIKPPRQNGKLVGSRDSPEWFGTLDNILLPWDNLSDRKVILKNKIDYASRIYEGVGSDLFNDDISKNYAININKTNKISMLKTYESEIDEIILSRNIEDYVINISQTEENHKEILSRFQLIKNDDDMSALWLENNTWRAFVSLKGEKNCKPNFNMELDLSPKSFAPGIGNTPDMEIYFGNNLIIPEVSLMTGKQQWKHEGSSVIDHVLQKINDFNNLNVIGLFISPKINTRTLWQFFILNKESWLGSPISVIPMTIDDFSDIIEYSFENKLYISDLEKLFSNIVVDIKKLNNYQQYEKELSSIIQQWKKNYSK